MFLEDKDDDDDTLCDDCDGSDEWSNVWKEQSITITITIPYHGDDEDDGDPIAIQVIGFPKEQLKNKKDWTRTTPTTTTPTLLLHEHDHCMSDGSIKRKRIHR